MLALLLNPYVINNRGFAPCDGGIDMFSSEFSTITGADKLVFPAPFIINMSKSLFESAGIVSHDSKRR